MKANVYVSAPATVLAGEMYKIVLEGDKDRPIFLWYRNSQDYWVSTLNYDVHKWILDEDNWIASSRLTLLVRTGHSILDIWVSYEKQALANTLREAGEI